MQHYRESARKPERRRFWFHNLGPMTVFVVLLALGGPSCLARGLTTGVEVECSAAANACTLHIEYPWREPANVLDLHDVVGVRAVIDERVRLGRGSLALDGTDRTVDLEADVTIARFAARALDDFVHDRHDFTRSYYDRGILVFPLALFALFVLLLGAATYVVRLDLELDAGELRLRARRWPWREARLVVRRSDVRGFEAVATQRGRRTLTALQLAMTDGSYQRLAATYDVQLDRMDALTRACNEWLQER